MQYSFAENAGSRQSSSKVLICVPAEISLPSRCIGKHVPRRRKDRLGCWTQCSSARHLKSEISLAKTSSATYSSPKQFGSDVQVLREPDSSVYLAKRATQPNYLSSSRQPLRGHSSLQACSTPLWKLRDTCLGLEVFRHRNILSHRSNKRVAYYAS